MTTVSALREGLAFFLLVGWENVYWLMKLLAICLVITAVAVVVQNGLMSGLPRHRADRAFSAFTSECRAVGRALSRRRAGEALDRVRQAIWKWFFWNNSTAVGRFGCTVMTALAVALTALSLVKLVWFFVEN